MYFNKMNYGSLESFAKHASIRLEEVERIVKQSKHQAMFEHLICDFLGIEYNTRIFFANGRVFKRKQDLADYIGLYIQGVNKALRNGKTLDEILLPMDKYQLRRRLSNQLRPISKEESKLLRSIHVSKMDAGVIMKLFNMDTYEEAYHFIKEQRANLRR